MSRSAAAAAAARLPCLRRPFSFKAFWGPSPTPTPTPADSTWAPAISGPRRPSKQQLREQHDRDAALLEASNACPPPPDLNVGHAGAAAPTRHVAVDIDGHERLFDTAFLRDSCACPLCRDPDSKQKLFQTSDIPHDLAGRYTRVADAQKGDAIELQWASDLAGYAPDHRTRLSIAWLRRALNTQVELRAGVHHDDRVLWDRAAIAARNKWLDYADYMGDDRVLFDALSHLNQYGLLFVRNVPDSETSVVDLASRIGALKDTFYGRTWDVRSKQKAENIAYTPHFLGLHMDLLYTSNPPHLQLLHSLRARTPGGASFFSDAFHAARQLQRLAPAHFRTLTTFPVTYHYHHATHHYHYTRPVIDLYPSQHYSDPTHVALRRVNWSPPFQGPFEVRTGSGAADSLRAFIAASHAYEQLLSSPDNLFEYRLNEGECVIFDNRRVLHARRAFDATKGERWLKGAYVDDDVFFSRLRVLQERFEGGWEAEGVVRTRVD